MQKVNYKILLIEDNPGDVRLIQEMLKDVKEAEFNFIHAKRLSEGIELLLKNGIDVVLLDLSLPDSRGLETFRSLRKRIPDIAVIVLTGLDDAETGMKAVQEGAQDYLIKGKVDGQLLFRSICYAVERNRMFRQLKELAVKDELTKLYNRRGFLNYGRELLEIAKRTGNPIFLLYVDLDGMKQINDNFGHQEGDRALIEISNIIKRTFRRNDIKARIGGDEFVVLGIATLWDKKEGLFEILVNRLKNNVEEFNSKSNLPYELSVSAGLVSFPPEAVGDIEQLLEEADKIMYEQKKKKKRIERENENKG